MSRTARGRRGRPNVYRKTLIALFSGREACLSVPEIQEALAAIGLTPNRTTLYRTIASLQAAGLIEPIPLPEGAQSYKASGRLAHHHHAVCLACHRVADIDLPPVEAALATAEQDLAQSGFRSTAHALTMYGVCEQCRTTESPA